MSRWLPLLLWMGVIFFLSSQTSLPRIGTPAIQFVLSKIAHLLEYVILAVLLLRVQESASGNLGKRAYLVAFLISLAYAASDEFHQSFVPYRRALAMDVGIDSLGAATGLVVIALVRKAKSSGNGGKTCRG
ncbi:MAG: VanZ family protein [Chloroflexota bacterium]